MSKFIVKLGYKVSYQVEIEVEAESPILALDQAVLARDNNALPRFNEVGSTRPAVISVWDKTP